MPKGIKGFQKGHPLYSKNIGDIVRGKPPWNKGVKGYSTKAKGKYKGISRNTGKTHFLKGHKPIAPFKKGMIPWNKGLKGFMAGAKNGRWKGGITSLIQIIRHLEEYRQWIKQVFEKDDYACQECNKKGSKLHAHHIKSFKLIFNEFLKEYNQFSPIEDKETLVRLAIEYEPFWDVSNGITYCKDCHKVIHMRIRQVRSLS